MQVDVIGFLYSGAIIVGGLYGYISAGSVPSLIAGLLFGLVSGYGAWRVSKNPSHYLIQLCSAITLACIMGVRFYNSGKILPGVVCLTSTLIIFYIVLRTFVLNNANKMKLYM